MKGYKVTNPDYTCRGYKFEVGKKYKIKGDLVICQNGFHFCEKTTSCFEYYSFNPENKVFEIEALGKVITQDDKSATDHIKIVRELTWSEVLTLVNSGAGNAGRNNSGNSNSGNWNSGNRNSGDSNSGYRNSGDWNSGNRNSGYRNSGDWNSGNSNSGYRNSGNRNSGNSNSGYRNSGNRNSGDSNSGDWNSGNWNSGNRNSGDSNSGYRNSGAFCTEPNPMLVLFDEPTNITVKEWENSEICRIMYDLLDQTMWIPSERMSEEERKTYPHHETTGGYLKTISMHEAWGNMWPNLTDEKKKLFRNLPNFDSTKFKQITGITLD